MISILALPRQLQLFKTISNSPNFITMVNICVCTCTCPVLVTSYRLLLSIQLCQRISIYLAEVCLNNGKEEFRKLSSEIFHPCWRMETHLPVCWNSKSGYRLWQTNECAWSWTNNFFACSMTSKHIGHGWHVNKGQFSKMLIISKYTWSLELGNAYWHFFFQICKANIPQQETFEFVILIN